MKGPFTYLNLSFKNIKLKYLDLGLLRPINLNENEDMTNQAK
jgi:hypothetical protein